MTDLPVARHSDLKSILRSPLHYRHAAERTGADSDTFRLGRAVHALVLEGIYPQSVKGSKRTALDSTDALKHSDTQRCLEMAAAVQRHAEAQKWLALCPMREVEVSREMMGAQCAGRPDAFAGLTSGAELVVELKTTRDASPAAFERDINRLMYGSQLSYYAHLLGVPNANRVIIAVENREPWAVACYWLRGRDDYDRKSWQGMLERYNACAADGEWHGYGPGTMEIGPPPWHDGYDDQDEGEEEGADE